MKDPDVTCSELNHRMRMLTTIARVQYEALEHDLADSDKNPAALAEIYRLDERAEAFNFVMNEIDVCFIKMRFLYKAGAKE